MSAFEVKLKEVTALLVDGIWRQVEVGSIEYANELTVWPDTTPGSLGNIISGGVYRYRRPDGDTEIIAENLVDGFRL